MRVRKALEDDVAACVDLVEARREQYERYEPRFWKKAAGSARMSRMWFAHLFAQTDNVALVAEEAGRIVGFIVATNYPAPPVFDPGGRNALIDDFLVIADDRWADVGAALFAACREALKELGFAQLVVVGAAKDAAKTAFLKATDLSLASTWWTAGT